MTTLNGQPATLDAAGFGTDTIRSPLDAAIERGLAQCPGVDSSLLSFHVHKKQADGTWAHCCKVAFNDFDEDGLARAYGAGSYRLFLRAPNRRSQLCNIDLTLAAPMSTQPGMLLGTTMPAAAPTAGVGSGAGGDMSAKDMLVMMMQAFSLQQQSQTTLMNTLLTRVMEPPQQRSMSELEALLALSERLSARGGDGGAESTITSQTINALGNVLSQALSQPRPPASAPPPGPRPHHMQLTGPPSPVPLSGPLPTTPTPGSHVVGASASTSAPSASASLTTAGEAQVVHEVQATDAQTAAFAEWVRVVEMTAGSSNRDPTSYATILADLVGDDALQIAIDQTPGGHLVDALLEAAPQLREQREFLQHVEAAVRELFEPDAGDAADNQSTTVEIKRTTAAGEDIPFGAAIAGGNAVQPSTLTAPAADKPLHATAPLPTATAPRSPNGRGSPGHRVASIAAR